MIEREDFSETAIATRLSHLLLAILIGFGAVGLALGYWSVVRTEALAGRPDNPRTVEAELRVQRGRILDRNNVVLAENSGPLNQQTRRYPLAEAGPAVGHYSLRYGTAGVEGSYDSVLRGADVSPVAGTLNELLHIPPAGRDVRMTLDSTLQQTGTRLMADRQGALVLIELSDAADQPAGEPPTADIRAMVSQPWYDPAQLDALFEDLGEGEDISFFNRVTQGQYQPGLVLLPLLAAQALDDDLIDPAGVVLEADRPVLIGNATAHCRTTPTDEPATWLEAVRWACPGAAVDLGWLLGESGLLRAWRELGLTSAPLVPILTAEATDPQIDEVLTAVLGQAALTLSPLQVALAYGALAANGQLPAPRLVEAVQSPAGRWTAVEAVAPAEANGLALLPASASLIRGALPRSGDITGLAASVVSAPDGQTNEWYVGLTPSDAPRYVVVVVLEQPGDPDAAEAIGQAMLSQALLLP